MTTRIAVQPGTRSSARDLIVWVLVLSANLGLCFGQNAAGPNGERDQAFALEQAGNIPGAEVAWQKVLRANPRDAEAWAHLGYLDSQQNRFGEAVACYRKAAVLSPSMPGLQLNMGLALFKDARLKEAISVLQPLLKQTPAESPGAERLEILLGVAYFGLGQYAAAVPYLKSAMAGDPQNLPYRLVLAQSCLRSKQYQCVLDTYHQILLLNAESAQADILAGEALDAMRDHEGAIQQFRAAEKVDPRDPQVHFGLGYLLWTRSRYDEAAEQFKEQLQLVPSDARAVAFLADSYVRSNQPNLARPLAEKAILMDPHNEMPHLDLGILDAAERDDNGALQEFRDAVRLHPTDVQAHWRLARLYQAMGMKKAADAEFVQSQKLTKLEDQTVYHQLESNRAKTGSAQANP